MKTNHLKNQFLNHGLSFFKSAILAGSLILTACGGGGGKCVEASARTFTQSQIESLTASEVKTITDVELQSLGTNIKYLTNDALAALQDGVVNTNIMCDPHYAQIYSITPEQIAVLTPDQINHIGSAENGVPKIDALSEVTFSKLVSDPIQVAAFTVAEVNSLKTGKFLAIGSNFSALSDLVLTNLQVLFKATPTNTLGQIYSITPSQISTLSPARVRILGSIDDGVSKINFLNPNSFAKLASDPVQVAAFTPAEIATFTSEKFALIGGNLHDLSNSVLASLQVPFIANPTNTEGQIHSITPAQISLFTPAQVRILGSFDDGISKINFLASNTFKQLANDQNQVSQITPTEITTLYSDRIVNLGTGIRYLSDAALENFSYQCAISMTNPQCQVESITYSQVAALSPAQIMLLAKKDGGKGIAYLNVQAFGALSGPQVAAFTPVNVVLVGPEQLAALSDVTLMSFQVATAKSFTPGQVSLLSTSQHSACGC